MKRILLIFLVAIAYAVSCFATDYAEVEDGKYYQIEHVAKSQFMTEDYLNGSGLIVTNSPENVYCQIWKAEKNAAGNYALKNLFTGRYIQAITAYYTQVTTGTDPYYFTFTEDDTTDPFSYAIVGGKALHSNNGTSVVGWSTGTNSQWRLIDTLLTADELAESERLYQEYKKKYDDYQNLKASEKELTETLQTYFDDYACTQLKTDYQQMSDEDLTAAMTKDNLPEQIIAMALKVKDNSWKQYVDGYDHLNEKFFRVQEYQIYSDESTWTGLLGASNARGRWSNPTGVIIPKSELAFVYVDQDIPDGAVLQLNGIRGTDTGSRVWSLQKGLNVIMTTEDDRMFMYYKMDNLDANNEIQYLSNFPDIKVHVEGGWVNGCWDETRDMDNEDWKAMIACDTLLKYPYVDIKGQYMCMLMNSEKVIAACPENIAGVMRVWNHIVKEEYRVLGVYYDQNNFSDRFNNLMNGFSITYDKSYMFASTWGGYYHEGTLSTIMNADIMLRGGGALWGPAHEMGHNNQAAMNMIGCTEISNNVFSNAVVWQWGKTTTRGSAPEPTFQKFEQGKSWYERDLWERTRLYYQLWQYFYVCKHDEDFYPKLYRALIASPMKKQGGTFCPADLDELHFAEVVCDVAQMDLTEFFEVYGFFQKPELQSYTISGTTQDAYLVDDYSKYYVTFEDWDAKVKATKDKLAQYQNKAGANLMFIEDRIEYTVSDDRTANPGVTRADYGSDVAVGKCGDVGSFTQYDVDATESGSAVDNYYFVVDGNTLALKGTGGVGFKIYDAEGNLVALSNEKTFTVSDEVAAALQDKGENPAFTLRVCEADGDSPVLSVAVSEERRLEAESKENAQHEADFKAGKFLKVIQNKLKGTYALYSQDNKSGDDIVLSTSSSVGLDNFFQVEPGRGANTDYYIIRLANDTTKYVYALNTNDANNNVCIKQITTGKPDEDCYWKISANSDGYNIIPKSGSCGWNIRGIGVGQWSSNSSDDNRWYLKTTAEVITAGDVVGLYKKTTSYDEALENFTHEVSESNYTALRNTLTEVNLPPTGCYYRLKNAASGKYMTATATGIGLGTDQYNDGTVFFLGEGNSLKSLLTGKYLDCQAKGATSAALAGEWFMAYGGPIANTLLYKNNGCYTYGAGNTSVGSDSLDRGSGTPNSAGYNWIVEPIYGDADNNGLVDVVDIARLIGHLNGGEEEVSNSTAADANQDGEITLEDVDCVVSIINKEK